MNDKGEDIKIEQPYESLSKADRAMLPTPQVPTTELINKWKDSQKFKVIKNYGDPVANLENLNPADYISYDIYKSEKEAVTYIFLIDQIFLETQKKLGGTFAWVNYSSNVFLAPPPPAAP